MAEVGGIPEQRVEQRYGGFCALEAEAFLAYVLGFEEALQSFGRVQTGKDVAVLFGASSVGAPSTWSWIHRFCSGSMMCMYSTPTVRQ